VNACYAHAHVFATASRPAMGPILRLPEAIYPGIQLPESEGYHFHLVPQVSLHCVALSEAQGQLYLYLLYEYIYKLKLSLCLTKYHAIKAYPMLS
jgi:hypothetical protein